MKKILFALLVLLCSTSILFAEESSESKKGADFDFAGVKVGLGASLAFRNPVLAAGTDGKFAYNPDFLATDKPVGIEDFMFGVPVRVDFIWESDVLDLGVQIDFDNYYATTLDFSDWTMENFTEKIKEKEHSLRADVNPMFVIQKSIFRFGFGPGASFDINVTQAAAAGKALKTADPTQIAPFISRIGLDPVEYAAVVDHASLRENLSWLQQLEFFGIAMDWNIKMTADFMLGKHFVVGGYFLVDFNTEMALWDKTLDTKTNFATVFNPDKFTGAIGFKFLYMF